MGRFQGVYLQVQIVTILRDQVSAIILGTVFLFIGLSACGTAAIRGRRGVRILTWFGVFSALYGLRILAQTPAMLLLPQSVAKNGFYLVAVVTYLITIPALLFWMELSRGGLRRLLQATAVAASVIGFVGVGTVFLTSSPFSWMPFNNVATIVILLIITIANAMPGLANRFLVIQSPVSVVGTLVLTAGAIYANLANFLHLPFYPYLEPTAFAVFIVSLGYVAAMRIFADERRLLSIENELAIAREIQTSILPSGVPEVESVNISAAYRPMTAVAGDFYEFIPVDRHRVGFLVADVSGHGVPAALIASMIKIAMQSVLPCAHQPQEVMRGLNRILSGQLRGQFVTAAYLWLDLERHTVLYSAAGHPPLLLWRDGQLQSIESNGLLFGVLPDADYPLHEMSLIAGDRYLLYTDGVVEPENTAGESFGSNRLEELVRANEAHSAAELSEALLAGIRQWQPASTTQKDDLTLIVIDVARDTPAQRQRS